MQTNVVIRLPPTRKLEPFFGLCCSTICVFFFPDRKLVLTASFHDNPGKPTSECAASEMTEVAVATSGTLRLENWEKPQKKITIVITTDI